MGNFGFFLLLLIWSTFPGSECSFLCNTLGLKRYCPDYVDYTTDAQQFCIAQPTKKYFKFERSSSLPKCSLDIVKFASGRTVLGSTFRTPSELLPPWANITLAQEGQKFAQNNLISVGLTALYGLIAVLTVPDSEKVLTFTHQTDSLELGTRRYIATAVQTIIWYQELLTKTDLTHNAWLTSIRNVRDIHRNATNYVLEHGFQFKNNKSENPYYLNTKFWNAVQKDLDSSTIPLSQRKWPEFYLKYESSVVPANQFMFALTQYAFLGYTIIRPEEVYLWEGFADKEGMHGLVHLWAIIGYALGIEDEYNVCLKSNMKEIKEYFQEIHDYFYVPAIFHMNHDVKVLVESLVEAINKFVPLSKYFPHGAPKIGTLFFIRLMRGIYQIPITNQYETLSKVDKIYDSLWDNVFIPGTKITTFRYLANKIGPDAIQLAVDIYFGPNYKTNMAKAKYVFSDLWNNGTNYDKW